MKWKTVTLDVSEQGDVRFAGKTLRPRTGTRGYRSVYLTVHRLIAHAFLGPPPQERMVVDHIDCNPRNNKASNLQWLTQRENTRRSSAKKRKLTDEQVIEIRHLKPNSIENLKDMAKRFGVSYSALRGIRSGINHKKGFSSTNRTILTPHQVRQAREWTPPRPTASEVATRYRVSTGTVYTIWKTC